MSTSEQFLKKKQLVGANLNAPTTPTISPLQNKSANSVTTPKSNMPVEPFQSPSTPLDSFQKQASANAINPVTNAVNQNQSIAPTSAPVTTTSTTPTNNTVPNKLESTIPEVKVDFSKGGVFDQYKPLLDQQYNTDKDFINQSYEQNLSKLENDYKYALQQAGANKGELEKAYNESKEELANTLYAQQEQANIESTRRGISYSPQTIGLKNANNATYNKNLTKLVEQKNKGLSDLNMKILQLEQDYAYNKKDLYLDTQNKFNNLTNDRNQNIFDSLLQEHRDKEAKK